MERAFQVGGITVREPGADGITQAQGRALGSVADAVGDGFRGARDTAAAGSQCTAHHDDRTDQPPEGISSPALTGLSGDRVAPETSAALTLSGWWQAAR